MNVCELVIKQRPMVFRAYALTLPTKRCTLMNSPTLRNLAWLEHTMEDQVITQVNYLQWKLLYQKLPTYDKLMRMGLNGPNICVLCMKRRLTTIFVIIVILLFSCIAKHKLAIICWEKKMKTMFFGLIMTTTNWRL